MLNTRKDSHLRENEAMINEQNQAQVFLNHLLYSPHSTPTIQYSDEPDDGCHLDISRLCNKMPCWGKWVIGHENQFKKKIIITDWSLTHSILADNQSDDIEKLWAFLLKQPVQIYVFTKLGLVEATDIEILMDALTEVALTTPEELKEILAKEKFAFKDCEIIDTQYRQIIQFKLQPLIFTMIYRQSPFINLDFDLLNEFEKNNPEAIYPLLGCINEDYLINITVNHAEVTNQNKESSFIEIISQIFGYCKHINKISFSKKFIDSMDLITSWRFDHSIKEIHIRGNLKDDTLLKFLSYFDPKTKIMLADATNNTKHCIDQLSEKHPYLTIKNPPQDYADEDYSDTESESPPFEIGKYVVFSDNENNQKCNDSIGLRFNHPDDIDSISPERMLFSLAGSININDASVIFKKFPRLKKITLTEITGRLNTKPDPLINISSLVAKELSYENLADLLVIFPHLEELSIDGIKNNSESMPALPFNLVKKLTLKALHWKQALFILHYFNHLEELIVENLNGSYEDFPSFTLDKLRRLKFLTREKSNNVEMLSRIAKNITWLEFNSIETSYDGSEKKLSNYSFNKLKFLSMEKSNLLDKTYIDVQEMEKIQKSSENPIKLSVTKNDKHLQCILSYRINQSKKITKTNIAYLSFLDVNDELISDTLKKCPLIEKITFSGIYHDETTGSFLNESYHLKSLSYLNLSRCDYLHITPQQLSQLIDQSPLVKVFVNNRTFIELTSDPNFRKKDIAFLFLKEKKTSILSTNASFDSLENIRKESHQPDPLDTDTTLDPNKTHRVSSFFEPKENHPVHPRNFRIAIYTDLQINPHKINYALPFHSIEPIEFNKKDNLYLHYNNFFKESSDVFYCSIEIVADSFSWFPLPSLSTNETIDALSSDAPIELGYCKEQSLYYVRPSENPAGQKIKIEFLLKKIPDLSIKRSNSTPSIPFEKLSFSPSGQLEKNINYSLVMEKMKNLTPHEIASALFDFCSGFSEGKLPTHSNNAIENLNAILHHKFGACRHRAWVFMALAKQLGIEARAIKNECHTFVEVNMDGNWCRADMGGFTAHVQIIPHNGPILIPKRAGENAELIKSIKEKILHEIKIEKKNAASLIPPLSANNPFKTWNTLQSKAKTWQDYCHDLLKAAMQLPEGKRKILITIDSEKIKTFYHHMSTYLSKNHRSFYCLNNLDEASEKQAIIKQNNLQTSPSQLVQLMENATDYDVMMVNFSGLKPHQIGYNTLFDSDRSWKNHALSPKLTLFTLLDKNEIDRKGEDFFSRLPLLSECPAILEEEKIQNALPLHAINETDFDKVEFFYDDWKKMLIGQIQLTIDENGHQQFHFQKGILSQAIVNNKGLILVNAPWHREDFQLFISELLSRGYFYENGEKIDLPKNFPITHQKRKFILNSSHTQLAEPSEIPDERSVLLNSETMKYFISRMQCENNHIHMKDGWIAQHAANELRVIVTETIPPASWALLVHLAQQHHCQLKLFLAENVTLPAEMALDVTFMPKIRSTSKTLRLISSNDLDITEEKLFHEKEGTLVLSIDDKTRLSDLVERISKTPNTDNDQLSFQSQQGTLWQHLMKGKRVILKGRLSETLAKELESLAMNPPYLVVNGEKMRPTGELIILSNHVPSISFIQTEKIKENLDFDNMLSTLKGKYHLLDAYQQLKNAYEIFHEKQPTIFFSYVQLKSMLNQLKTGKLSNPFKPFLRLNPNDPALRDAKIAWDTVTHPHKKEKNIDEMLKRNEKISSLLKDASYLFIAGPSGVGKSTYAINELKKDHAVYVGIDQLNQWLADDSKNKPVLFIDEANLECEGSWDILEGLFNQTPGILLKGTFHPLTKDHKVVFAGNYNHFEGRTEHRYIKRHGQVINFKEMPDSILKKYILLPALTAALPNIYEKENIMSLLCDIYSYINKQLPNHPMTPRNLKMICLRLKRLIEHPPSLSNNTMTDLLNFSIIEETSDFFKDKKEKFLFEQQFKLNHDHYQQAQHDIFNNSELSIEQFILTESRVPPLLSLHKHCMMRDMLIKQSTLHSFDLPGLLIEGLPGIGKSYLPMQYLTSQGFKKGDPDVIYDNNTDTRKLFYHLTPTDPAKMQKTLLKAFHEGAVIICDELNSLPFERLINQLLSGTDLEGHPPKKKGFLLIATQNPISFEGRHALSTAMENRFIKINLENYPDAELKMMLIEMCQDKHFAEYIFTHYIAARHYAIENKKSPTPTPRNLFSYLEGKNVLKKRFSKNLLSVAKKEIKIMTQNTNKI